MGPKEEENNIFLLPSRHPVSSLARSQAGGSCPSPWLGSHVRPSLPKPVPSPGPGQGGRDPAGAPRGPGAVQGPAPTPPLPGELLSLRFSKTLSQTSPFITVQQHILLVCLYLRRDSSPLLRYPRALLKLNPKHTLECQFCLYLPSHRSICQSSRKMNKARFASCLWCASTRLFIFS